MLPVVVLPVVVETGSRRTFASVLDWPGWCRAARDEAGALLALEAYRSRYRPVVESAGLVLPDPAGDAAGAAFEVVERLPGGGATDFGVPEAIATWERTPPSQQEAERLASIMTAAWDELTRVAARSPAELRKGPRGGGRDRDAIVDHVAGAEQAYARQLGRRHRPPAPGDHEAVATLRADLLATVRAGHTPDVEHPARWPVRYGVRRIVWHVLDHAWEMEDRG